MSHGRNEPDILNTAPWRRPTVHPPSETRNFTEFYCFVKLRTSVAKQNKPLKPSSRFSKVIPGIKTIHTAIICCIVSFGSFTADHLLTSDSSSVTPTHCISSFTTSVNVLCSLPLFLL